MEILCEEVYVRQSKGFENPHLLDHVYKLNKALYGLKQAPHAWYGRLTEYLLEIGFKRGEVEKTFFIQKSKCEILICQVYVDYITFGSSSQKHTDDFVECMSSTFEMSMVGFYDADWAGDLDDRKSTSGCCFYLDNNLISWHSRKQNCISLSTAESEYVAAGKKKDGKSYLKDHNEGCAFGVGETPSEINTEIEENRKSYLEESSEDRSSSVKATTSMFRKLFSH
ncbi:uncharacterized protein [Primulina huaijiensis]|uniref:uncharacterized protein n=1 Tax=Primulina huaijiensis TaxID=1492673 RepID=UPI003CC76AD1